ncbi:MAG: methyltransferase family protein [Streptosporangiaceae bacterium]
MSRRPVRRLVALYPRAWRERYGSELGDLTDELISEGRTTRLRAGFGLVEGAAIEHGRALARSPAAALGGAAAITAGAGIGLAVARPRGAAGRPYFDTPPAGFVLLAVAAAWLLLEFIHFLQVQEAQEWRAGATRSSTPGFWAASAACVIAWETWLYQAPAIVPAAAIRPAALAFSAGLVFFLAGMGLRGWSFAALGRYSTYAIVVSPGQPVVATGPYRLLRHPSYTGGLLIGAGAGLMSANWASLAAMTLLPLAVTVWRIRLEETALLTGLGDRYRAYACDRKRLVPLIW